MLETDLNFIESAKNLIIELAIIGLVFFGIEKIRPAERSTPFFKSDFKRELGLALLNGGFFMPLFSLGLALVFLQYVTPIIPYQMFSSTLSGLPIVAQMLLGAFIADFSTYWRHRFTHYYMWSYHSVHHSVQQITWLTALRLHPVDILVAMTFDMVVLYILGFSGPGAAFAALFIRFYNYFTHANINLQFGKPWRYIFASPNFHRWHHATDESAYNKNFCSTFSLLDLMFGTFHHPENVLPENYGLSPPQMKEYPSVSLPAQLIYPFQRTYRLLREKISKNS